MYRSGGGCTALESDNVQAQTRSLQPAADSKHPTPPMPTRDQEPKATADANQDSFELFSLAVPEPAVQSKGSITNEQRVVNDGQQVAGLSMTSASHANTSSLAAMSTSSWFSEHGSPWFRVNSVR